MLMMLLALACGPKSDSDCVAYTDTCNSGCEPQCGTTADADLNETCDLGCFDTGATTDDDCVLRDGECTWLIEVGQSQ